MITGVTEMKKISVVIPCYNDSASVRQMHERLTNVFANKLPEYDYDITFCDDRSPDDGNTWNEIKKVCAIDKKCRAVRNVRNFGIYRNPFAAMRYGNGDAVFMIYGDIQDPPEYLPEMVAHWQNGHKVVLGVRQNQYYNAFFTIMRNMYYGIISKLTSNQQIVGASSFGLYDRSFVDILHDIDDVQPILTGVVTEYASDIKVIQVTLEKGGRDGKSNLNFWGKYDTAMVSFTSYTKMLLRLCTFIGLIIGALSFIFAVWVFIMKILNWDSYPLGIPALTVGMFFLGAVQLFFLGIIGEYILAINNRSIKRPLTAVDEYINFEDKI